ncbi:unnamed protein product [Rotaria sordida]|uniref:Uncharacterized protein n=1 Tax=Rotaria sordida TaxID=392033 RepID=A0A815TT90_9BILA|nr:unnamed protein product [Rotaria sordida]CAF1656582.1 unnamed protein product [Rotaria sordida]
MQWCIPNVPLDVQEKIQHEHFPDQRKRWSKTSGFYLTQNSLKIRHTISTTIDIIEKSPSFVSLNRYDGVALDHSEVKNVIQVFTTITGHEHHFDGARSLLSSIEDLAKTDITDIVVLDTLCQSRI